MLCFERVADAPKHGNTRLALGPKHENTKTRTRPWGQNTKTRKHGPPDGDQNTNSRKHETHENTAWGYLDVSALGPSLVFGPGVCVKVCGFEISEGGQANPGKFIDSQGILDVSAWSDTLRMVCS